MIVSQLRHRYPAILGAVGGKRQHPERARRTDWLIAVGQRFKELREEKGVDQDALPSPRPTISNFENGDGIHLGLLVTWCEAAGILPADVFRVDLTRQTAAEGSARPTSTGDAVDPAAATRLQERETHYRQTIAELRRITLTLVNVLEGEDVVAVSAKGRHAGKKTATRRRRHRGTG